MSGNAVAGYRGNTYLPFKIYDNFFFGCSRNLERKREDNTDIPLGYGELAANVGLYILEQFPKKTWKLIHEPRFATVCLTTLAFVGNSRLWYKEHTLNALNQVVKHIPIPPQWTVKFAAYVLTSTFILSYGVRALSRFTNEELARSYYGQFYDAVFQTGK